MIEDQLAKIEKETTEKTDNLEVGSLVVPKEEEEVVAPVKEDTTEVVEAPAASSAIVPPEDK